MRDRRHVEDGVVIHRSVESRVITERSFSPGFTRLDISLDHEITLSWDLQRLSHALDQIDRFLAGEPRKEDLVDTIG